MDVTPLISSQAKVIQGYTKGGFRVSGEVYEEAVQIFPDRVEAWSAPEKVAELTPDHFAEILSGNTDVELVLLGCGDKMALPPKALKQAFRDKGVALEPMETGAACRTYNVLLADGRKLAAALMPI